MLDLEMLKVVSKQLIPVLFALFINLLDACTFGVCFFPTKLGLSNGLAIELFLLSTALVQIALIGMSSFSSALGTSMAENIPFIHTIANGVIDSMTGHKTEEIIATVLITVSISTILNGSLFYLLGYFKLGHILHFFPRHVILGLTGGFGVFLLQTAFEVCTGIALSENNFKSIALRLSWDRAFQLLLVVGYGVFIRVVESYKFGGHLAVPLLMFALPLTFYIGLAISGSTFQQARQLQWLFPVAPSAPWWSTWEPFRFFLVDWSVVARQWATVFSLAAFTLLLVPVRIPSLALITGEDVDFDTELKAQGIGNVLSGLVGCPHNYLSYSNSIFYLNCGGVGKVSQGAVALLTLFLFLYGPSLLNIIPRMLAGVIMLHLGYDLIHAAVVASRSSLDTLEYAAVIGVGTVVSVLGFVPGIAAGGVAACVTFVVQASQVSNIRGVFTGDAVRSNTNWPARLREKLETARRNIVVIQLQGHLFFGNVQQVVKGVMAILEEKLPPPHSEDGLRISIPDTKQPKKFEFDSSRLNKDSTEKSPLLDHPSQLDNGVLRQLAGSIQTRLRSRSSSFSAFMDVDGAAKQSARRKTLEERPLPKVITPKSAKTKDYHLQHLVLDCSFVTGMDGNAIAGLLKLKRSLAAQAYPIELEFAGVAWQMQTMFALTERALTGGQATTSSTTTVAPEKVGIPTSPMPPGLPLHRRDSGTAEPAMVAPVPQVPCSLVLGVDTDMPTIDTEADISVNYYSDVNTALTHVEEAILDTMRSPKKPASRGYRERGCSDMGVPGEDSIDEFRLELPASTVPVAIPRPKPMVNEPEMRMSFFDQAQDGHGSFQSWSEFAARVGPDKLGWGPALQSRLGDSRSLDSRTTGSGPDSGIHEISRNYLPLSDGLEIVPGRAEELAGVEVHYSITPPQYRDTKPTEVLSDAVLAKQTSASEIFFTLSSESSTTVEERQQPVMDGTPRSAVLTSVSTVTRRRSVPAMWFTPHIRDTPQQNGGDLEGQSVVPETMLMITGAATASHPMSSLASSVAASLPFAERDSSVSTVTWDREGRWSSGERSGGTGHRQDRSPGDRLFEPDNDRTAAEREGTRAPSAGSRKPPLSLSAAHAVVTTAPGSEVFNEAVYRENKQIIRSMLLDLSSTWRRADEAVLKRLSRHLLSGVVEVRKGQSLWSAGDTATQMGLLMKGRLKAVLKASKYGSSRRLLQSERVLQVVLPGCFVGELGVLSKGNHSRTILAEEDSLVALLSLEKVEYIDENDKDVYFVLQTLALKTAASRSHELMLFNAGSLGP